MGLSSDSLCACGSKQKYKRCCRKYHNGEKPPNALFLMKARYAAYAAQNVEFIMKTTHPQNTEYKSNFTEWAKEISEFCEETKFHNLQVLKFEDGSQTAFVTFKAIFSQNNIDSSFTEKSCFHKVNGDWLYFSGEFLN